MSNQETTRKREIVPMVIRCDFAQEPLSMVGFSAKGDCRAA